MIMVFQNKVSAIEVFIIQMHGQKNLICTSQTCSHLQDVRVNSQWGWLHKDDMKWKGCNDPTKDLVRVALQVILYVSYLA